MFKIHIEVPGKGKGYVADVEVSPTEPLDVLRSRVSFFKIFLQRRFALFIKESNQMIDDYSMTFRDVGL